MRTRIPLLAALLLALFALASCGDEEKNGPKLGGGKIDGARVSWGEPSGDPTGVVLLVHGGGWQRSDSGYAEQKANTDAFHDNGYATVAVGYDEGAEGLRQLEAVYEEARKRYPDLPICASGISAGGHLSLMLAARKPELDCVLALSAPTDLTTLAAQDPEGSEAYQAAVAAFGSDQLARFSPVRYADRIEAKVLIIIAESDPLAPVAQGEELTNALPGAELVVLPAGPVQAPFAHFGGVEANATNEVIERSFDFLESSMQGD